MATLPEVLEERVPIESLARALSWIAEERQRMQDFDRLVYLFQFCNQFICQSAMAALASQTRIQTWEERNWIQRGASGQWSVGWVPAGDVADAVESTVPLDSIVAYQNGELGEMPPDYKGALVETDPSNDEHTWRMGL